MKRARVCRNCGKQRFSEDRACRYCGKRFGAIWLALLLVVATLAVVMTAFLVKVYAPDPAQRQRLAARRVAGNDGLIALQDRARALDRDCRAGGEGAQGACAARDAAIERLKGRGRCLVEAGDNVSAAGFEWRTCSTGTGSVSPAASGSQAVPASGIEADGETALEQWWAKARVLALMAGRSQAMVLCGKSAPALDTGYWDYLHNQAPYGTYFISLSESDQAAADARYLKAVNDEAIRLSATPAECAQLDSNPG